MAKRSLILTSTSNQGKKIQKTITDINPNATGENLLTFAQKLNAMSTNVYVQTDCIDKFNVDTEVPPADTRPTPTITLNATPSAATINSTNGQQLTATYTGDGVWYCYIKGANYYNISLLTASATSKIFTLKKEASNDIPVGAVIGFIAEGTDTYKPVTVEFEIQA